MRCVSPGCVWINNHFWSRWIFATMKGNRLVPNELESHCWDGWMANCSKDMENYVKLRKRSGGSKLTKKTFQLFNNDTFGIFSKIDFYLWWKKDLFCRLVCRDTAVEAACLVLPTKCPKLTLVDRRERL